MHPYATMEIAVCTADLALSWSCLKDHAARNLQLYLKADVQELLLCVMHCAQLKGLVETPGFAPQSNKLTQGLWLLQRKATP